MSYSGQRRVPGTQVVPLRTFDPKYAHYFANGSGRDCYVEFNNGGFSVSKPRAKIEGTSFMRFGNFAGGSHSPRMDPSPVDYHSDGSGRDGYIVCNSGGLKQMFNKTCGEQFFR